MTVTPPSMRILITAGPTHEPIDSVRYIGNRSSGRLGTAIARAAIAAGYRTTLLLGPATVTPPDGSQVAIHRFRTTDDLQRLLAEHWPEHDVLLMAAAVADFRPADPLPGGKLSRDGGLALRLEPTPDLLAGLRSITRPDQRIIGFALEPADRLITSARAKLQRKGLDVIVANPLETMDSRNITATVIGADGTVTEPGTMTKEAFAVWLLDAFCA